MIEVELRGAMTKVLSRQLTSYSLRHGKLLGEYKQITVFCEKQISLQLSYDIQKNTSFAL